LALTPSAIHGPSQVELLLTVTVTTLLLICQPSIKPTVLFKVAIASALILVTFLWLLLVKTIVAPIVVVQRKGVKKKKKVCAAQLVFQVSIGVRVVYV
jgi:hypothetical protein